MSRALRVSPKYINQVKSVLRRNGYSRQKDLAEDLQISIATVNKFLNGKPVDHLNFLELSRKLGLDWKDIADFLDTDEANSDPASLPSSSEYGEGSSSTLNKVEANESNPNRKTIKVLVEFKGSISEADKPKLVALIAQLQALAADSSLAMKIVEGSEEESEEG